MIEKKGFWQWFKRNARERINSLPKNFRATVNGIRNDDFLQDFIGIITLIFSWFPPLYFSPELGIIFAPLLFVLLFVLGILLMAHARYVKYRRRMGD